jgi:hypothetical protein
VAGGARDAAPFVPSYGLLPVTPKSYFGAVT